MCPSGVPRVPQVSLRSYRHIGLKQFTLVNSLRSIAHICAHLFNTFEVHSAYMRAFAQAEFTHIKFRDRTAPLLKTCRYFSAGVWLRLDQVSLYCYHTRDHLHKLVEVVPPTTR